MDKVSQENWQFLPPAPDKCQECAVAHEVEAPHNRESMFYQMRFRSTNGRWPTWADAMAHCTPEVKDQWLTSLRELGVKC